MRKYLITFYFVLCLFIFCLFFQNKKIVFLVLDLLHIHNKLYAHEFAYFAVAGTYFHSSDINVITITNCVAQL